ncbi:hypothetical protein HRbin15_00710 [bacterium HR15]|nr:hypothetical protein HRbin15_00710 [bacterium HR15]
MEIPKPIGIAIVAVVAILALALVWYFSGGAGVRSGEVKPSAYPEYKRNAPLPDSELRGPEVPPPIAGARGGRR